METNGLIASNVCDLRHQPQRPLSLLQSRIQPLMELRRQTAGAGARKILLTKEAAMVNDDIVKCPLCNGFTHIEKPELREALKNPRLREQIEQYIVELLKSPVEELANVGATQAGRDFQKRDFQKDVHSWNPCVPMWRRSPKE